MEEFNESPDPLFVPVRRSSAGTLTPLTARLPAGPRVGVAFTGLAALRAASGPAQEWIRLSEHALRGLLSPLGIDRIQLDPMLVAADVNRPTPVRNVPRPATAQAVDR
ncbi:SAV_915 family protein [Actinoallomurus sp. NPDC050550]|uniref:SAV_915 family protein n=1 Tax=Actinoallomurus sp. NPDC050550 TaxID=3154937 RepID=UPI0033D58155